MYLNYLDLCVTCSIFGQMLSLNAIKREWFRRHGFSKHALLSRWKQVKSKLDRPTDQGDFPSLMGTGSTYRATLQAVRWNQSNLFDVSKLFRSVCHMFHRGINAIVECYKTVMILETRFQEAGAAESLEIRKVEVGSSNRSGRLCKLYGTTFNKSGWHSMPSDEINLICLMYLVLKAIKQCSFWRHGSRK